MCPEAQAIKCGQSFGCFTGSTKARQKVPWGQTVRQLEYHRRRCAHFGPQETMGVHPCLSSNVFPALESSLREQVGGLGGMVTGETRVPESWFGGVSTRLWAGSRWHFQKKWKCSRPVETPMAIEEGHWAGAGGLGRGKQPGPMSPWREGRVREPGE